MHVWMHCIQVLFCLSTVLERKQKFLQKFILILFILDLFNQFISMAEHEIVSIIQSVLSGNGHLVYKL